MQHQVQVHRKGPALDPGPCSLGALERGIEVPLDGRRGQGSHVKPNQQRRRVTRTRTAEVVGESGVHADHIVHRPGHDPQRVERAGEREHARSGEFTKAGLNPTIPQKAAGRSTEPAVWVPIATGTSPAATAAADPALDPPGVWPPSHGLCVGAGSAPANAVVVVLPTTRPPAARIRRTMSASGTGPKSAGGCTPRSVRGVSVAMTSLTPNGTPDRRLEDGLPASTAESSADASSSASSNLVAAHECRCSSSAARAWRLRTSAAAVQRPLPIAATTSLTP